MGCKKSYLGVEFVDGAVSFYLRGDVVPWSPVAV